MVRNYGVALYGAAWVPSAAESENNRYVVLAGGGCSVDDTYKIENAILLLAFDFESNSLPDEPVARLGTGSESAFRIAVHPGGEGLICSFDKRCRWFEWDHTDEHTLSVKPSNKSLKQLEDVGQQIAMTFNNEGTLLALGGEDGKLRVIKWPEGESTLEEEEANFHASVYDLYVRDLDFSPDGKFLVSVGSGLARIWNVATSACVASLPRPNDEIFFHARFSRSSDTDQVLYVTKNGDKGGSILKWNTSSWERISSTYVSREKVSAFAVSPDGKLISIGTNGGDILIISCANMRVQSVVRKPHLLFVTALAFSLDSRALLSASCDSSARVTLIKDLKKRDGMILWTILVIFLAVAIFFARNKDFLPLNLL